MSEAVLDLIRLAGFAEFESRAAREPATRSMAATVLVFTLSSDPHMLSRDRASRMEALSVLLTMPLTIQRIHADVMQPFAAIARFEKPYPLLHWLVIAIGGRVPDEPPPLAGVDAVWLDRVIAAHGDAPWMLRLLAVRAEVA